MAAESALHGIDVSHYQNTVSWPEVAQSGVAFAFAKATEGITYVDSMFSSNWDGIKSAGLVRGAYHYYVPGDDPEQQARHFLTTVNLGAGDLPPALDIETLGDQTAAEVVQGIEAWLATVEKAVGRMPIVYTNLTTWQKLGSTQFGRYPLWIAEYGRSVPELPAGWTSWAFWQYSQQGTTPGVPVGVDLDRFQGSREDLLRMTLPGPR